ncbi:alpha/beta fold hydrolase [Symbioplanes lichenis]|uniref:alpha/beta fold hydrolase n=1 Tax=Symbioplanes lichenis TaxID=1629072 RepID=UPI002739F145|nr:alpha/beta fold hydrolase [Actinoplanes lichenis]
MTTYVLVAGAGLGGWVWRKVRRLLEAEGHSVHTPSLTGEGDRVHLLTADVDLETHVRDVSNILTYDDLTEVVLVGHSYGGGVVTGVADRVPGRIARLESGWRVDTSRSTGRTRSWSSLPRPSRPC